MDYTTTALLDNARTNCMTPEADALFTDTRLLSILTFEQMTTLVPQILSAQEEYFVHVVDVPLVAGTSEYAIPERAIGKKLRNVTLVDGAGAELPLSRLFSQNIPFVGPTRVDAFYVQNNSIMLFSSLPTQYVSMRMRYYRRPSSLVATGSAARITVINSGSSTVTVDILPGTWAVGNTVDFIDATPSFDSLLDDAAITVINNADVSFAALPAGLAVGDWLSLSGTTPIPQLPYEAHPLLAQLGACKALEAMGDANIKIAWARYQQMASSFFKLITPRTDAPVTKIVSPNNISQRGFMGRIYGS